MAVLSFGLWQEMGGSPSIVGSRADARRHTAHRDRRDAARVLVPRSVRARLDAGAAQSGIAELELHARRPRRAGPRRRGDGGAGRAIDGDARRALRLPRAVGQDEGRAHHAAPRRLHGRHATRAARHARRDGADPPDRVRERRRAHARAGRRAVRGVCRPFGAWCEPAAADAAAHRRGAAHRDRRRRARRGARVGRLRLRHARAAAWGVGRVRSAGLARVRVGDGDRHRRGLARRPCAHHLALPRRPARRVEQGHAPEGSKGGADAWRTGS